LGVIKAQLAFLYFAPDWNQIVNFLTKFFIGVLAIIAIYVWISFRIRNLIANLGIGLTGIALAILLNGKGGLTIFLPYSFPIKMLNYLPNPTHFLEDYHIVSLIYFPLIFCLSYWDFTKRFNG